jgi:hypothetical protein
MRRLLAIGFIWFCCAVAWGILGASLQLRSSTSFDGLGESVRNLWGPALVQQPPRAVWREKRTVVDRELRDVDGTERTVEVPREVLVDHAIPLDATDVRVELTLDQRRKGLLWFPTYGVAFQGRYAFRSDAPGPREVEVAFPVVKSAVYDGLVLRGVDGKELATRFEDGAARFTRTLAAGETLVVDVAYRSRGTERFAYGDAETGLGPEPGRARDVRIAVATDFAAVDFPEESLSPTSQKLEGKGWEGEWRFEQVIASRPVAITLPQRLNPGPFAARLTFFAPVGLLFFLFVSAVLLAAARRSIHPMNYVLLACAFFAFHLLFAYTIDHLEVGAAFALASAVSVGLAGSYARLFLGWRGAALYVALPQLLYLVLFSFTFFWRGYTGLAVTVGAIVTLATVMQLTGKVDWAAAFSRPLPPPGAWGTPVARGAPEST